MGLLATGADRPAVAQNAIDGVVNQMDQVRPQNGAMVEQSTAASHALANQAIELARLMGQFTIGAVAPQAAALRLAAPSAAKPLRAKAYATRGSAAVRHEPAFEADSWEEF
ncbi:MAG: hypothetical protein Q8Q88_10870 [Phenylobacterium sp.]|uniref:hypothetical protein n=1 Tax=Phenylobacterium sp. TaxID=1871053 RepID=UPI002737784D|nr:hypothetical protein [Phenylobacterium sp.]MDP3747535.1 hypothetical protein [Phenylobacterium sp.]